MLEQLFGSRTRVKLLNLFLANSNQSFYVRELTRELGEQINSIRRELANLEKIGLLTSDTKQFKKYYKVNPQFILYQELRSLLLKSRLTLEKKFLSALQKVGPVQYLALTGYFVDDHEAPVDIFVVGKVNKNKLAKLLEQFGSSFGQELRYTAMDPAEYKYRREVTDKFLYDIINRRKIVVLNKTNQEK